MLWKALLFPLLATALLSTGLSQTFNQVIEEALRSRSPFEKIAASSLLVHGFSPCNLDQGLTEEVALRGVFSFLKDKNEDVRQNMLLLLAHDAPDDTQEGRKYCAAVFRFLQQEESGSSPQEARLHKQALRATARAFMSREEFDQWEDATLLPPLRDEATASEESAQRRAVELLAVISPHKIEADWIRKLLFSQYLEIRTDTLQGLHLILHSRLAPRLARDLVSLKTEIRKETYAIESEMVDEFLKRVDAVAAIEHRTASH